MTDQEAALIMAIQSKPEHIYEAMRVVITYRHQHPFRRIWKTLTKQYQMALRLKGRYPWLELLAEDEVVLSEPDD